MIKPFRELTTPELMGRLSDLSGMLKYLYNMHQYSWEHSAQFSHEHFSFSLLPGKVCAVEELIEDMVKDYKIEVFNREHKDLT